MSAHHVRIWRDKDPDSFIRRWSWRCDCQRWKPWLWERHWTYDQARVRALSHLETGEPQ